MTESNFRGSWATGICGCWQRRWEERRPRLRKRERRHKMNQTAAQPPTDSGTPCLTEEDVDINEFRFPFHLLGRLLEESGFENVTARISIARDRSSTEHLLCNLVIGS